MQSLCRRGILGVSVGTSIHVMFDSPDLLDIVSKKEEFLSQITVNPRVMVGKLTIRWMRISVEQILRALAAGRTEAELAEEFPELEKEDFRAINAYVVE